MNQHQGWFSFGAALVVLESPVQRIPVHTEFLWLKAVTSVLKIWLLFIRLSLARTGLRELQP